MKKSIIVLVALSMIGCSDDPSTATESDSTLDLAADTFREVSSNDGVEDLDQPDSDASMDTETEEPDFTPTEPDVAGDPDAEPDESPFDPGEFDDGEETEFVPRSVDENRTMFPLPVQAGAMTDSSVILWAYSPDTSSAELRVWRPSGNIGTVIQVARESVEPNDGGYFRYELGDLAPGTHYRYAFYRSDTEEGEPTARTVIGRFRTATAPGSLESITIGATTCTNQRFAPWGALELLAEYEMDFSVHLGDMSYNDAAETLDEYREIWRENLSDPGYQALLPAAGHYVTWDDHEVDNDWNPETLDPDRIEAAKTAFFETLPTWEGEFHQLWTSYDWGETLEVIILDSRSERLPSTRFGDGATYIGVDQMEWLQERLLNSTAHFKVILNSVPITNMPLVWDLAAGDRWEGYRAQRQELLDFLTDNAIENVWFLTGDFHVGFVSRIEPEGPANVYREISVGPGGNGPNPIAAGLDLDPQFEYSDLSAEVATLLTFDPVEDLVHVKYVRQDETVLYEADLRFGE